MTIVIQKKIMEYCTKVGYEVVLSFAGEQRGYVQKVANFLKSNNIKVFYDHFEEANLWGRNLAVFLHNVIQNAQYCIIFISRDYVTKGWPRYECDAALAKALKEGRVFILPCRFDDTELPGIHSTIQYVDLRKKTPEELGALILQKLKIVP